MSKFEWLIWLCQHLNEKKKKKTTSVFNNIFFVPIIFPFLYFFSQSLTKIEKHKWIFCFFHLSQWLIFCSKRRSTKPLPFISIKSTTSSSIILWSKSLTFSLTKIHPFSVKADLCQSPNRQRPSISRWTALIWSTMWRLRSKMKKSSPNQQRLIFAGKQSECTLADYNI